MRSCYSLLKNVIKTSTEQKCIVYLYSLLTAKMTVLPKPRRTNMKIKKTQKMCRF